jgi:hypothetical protein
MITRSLWLWSGALAVVCVGVVSGAVVPSRRASGEAAVSALWASGGEAVSDGGARGGVCVGGVSTVVCHTDADCSSVVNCTWCRDDVPGPHPQLCGGPPSPTDCGTLPAAAITPANIQ